MYTLYMQPIKVQKEKHREQHQSAGKPLKTWKRIRSLQIFRINEEKFIGKSYWLSSYPDIIQNWHQIGLMELRVHLQEKWKSVFENLARGFYIVQFL